MFTGVIHGEDQVLLLILCLGIELRDQVLSDTIGIND